MPGRDQSPHEDRLDHVNCLSWPHDLKQNTFRDVLSIPGGFINEGETVEDAMKREAKEETSLVLEPIAILGVYSDPNRDPKVEKNCKQLKLGQTTYWPSMIDFKLLKV